MVGWVAARGDPVLFLGPVSASVSGPSRKAKEITEKGEHRPLPPPTRISGRMEMDWKNMVQSPQVILCRVDGDHLLPI
ncbi:hypothetical protein ASPFODRAFT_38818 [Aspergillus luchuensis CBS 106.47]|uniref:Uncharacterized protein n=1 Tax=Aspergillus luchuensis (strain CBS 106.47) TaxID=1137211 RepID=A0A1M3TY13_ASPLC|nr:hypothetical protein ASPFODRAFT_38818 [Aspergillus luchuensis CBS 106.47]